MVPVLTFFLFQRPVLKDQFVFLPEFVFDELNLGHGRPDDPAGMAAFVTGWFAANRHPPRLLLRNLERCAFVAGALGVAALGLSVLGLLSGVFRSELGEAPACAAQNPV